MYNNHSLDDEDEKYRLKSSLLHQGKSSTASPVEGDDGSPEAGAAAAGEAITSHEESNISSKDSGRGDGRGDSGSRYDHTNTSRRHVVKVLMENIGHCLAICTFLGLIVGIPTLFFCMAQDKQLGKDYAAFYSAGLFVMLTVPISIREITKHLTNWVSNDFYCNRSTSRSFNIIFMDCIVYARSSEICCSNFMDGANL